MKTKLTPILLLLILILLAISQINCGIGKKHEISNEVINYEFRALKATALCKSYTMGNNVTEYHGVIRSYHGGTFLLSNIGY